MDVLEEYKSTFFIEWESPRLKSPKGDPQNLRGSNKKCSNSNIGSPIQFETIAS